MQTIISDLGGVLLFPVDKTYTGKLNPIYAEQSTKDNFNFFDHFELNTEMLNKYKNLKENGVTFYMITEGIIQNAPEIKPQLDAVFTQIFSSEELGFSKKDPQLYKQLIEKLKINLADSAYIDDNEDNVKAAIEAGLKSIRHISNSETISQF